VRLNGLHLIIALIGIATALVAYAEWRHARAHSDTWEAPRCDAGGCGRLLPGDGSAYTVWRATSAPDRYCSMKCAMGRAA
jgi:hypothetical protein